MDAWEALHERLGFFRQRNDDHNVELVTAHATWTRGGSTRLGVAERGRAQARGRRQLLQAGRHLAGAGQVRHTWRQCPWVHAGAAGGLQLDAVIARALLARGRHTRGRWQRRRLSQDRPRRGCRNRGTASTSAGAGAGTGTMRARRWLAWIHSYAARSNEGKVGVRGQRGGVCVRKKRVKCVVIPQQSSAGMSLREKGLLSSYHHKNGYFQQTNSRLMCSRTTPPWTSASKRATLPVLVHRTGHKGVSS